MEPKQKKLQFEDWIPWPFMIHWEMNWIEAFSDIPTPTSSLYLHLLGIPFSTLDYNQHLLVLDLNKHNMLLHCIALAMVLHIVAHQKK
jgi:hypothetical protein